ncbi:MAG TPA: hypothetical protein PLD84_05400 [Chitinophagales bacterium]|nr:hypothetical protein [Chitinophagales bacterium]
MKKLLLVFFAAIALLTGCAKIPVESVQLSDAIMMEGTRMHNTNIGLLNDLFNEKKQQVSDFIEKDYLPEMVKNFTGMVAPEDINAANLSDILLALVPQITQRRDAMIQALEEQRLKLESKMNSEYQVYYDASITLRSLLQSAVEVDRERAALNDRIRQLSGEKIDLNKIEHTVDEFITKAGSPDSIQGAILELDTRITEILNQQK